MTDQTAPERPLLHGERVWLRPLEERDMPAYVAGINDTEVGGMAGYAGPLSVAQATAWLGRVMEGWGRDGYYFAICPLGEDRFMGTAWLKAIRARRCSAGCSASIVSTPTDLRSRTSAVHECC